VPSAIAKRLDGRPANVQAAATMIAKVRWHCTGGSVSAPLPTQPERAASPGLPPERALVVAVVEEHSGYNQRQPNPAAFMRAAARP
jgi:hypothetical protein